MGDDGECISIKRPMTLNGDTQTVCKTDLLFLSFLLMTICLPFISSRVMDKFSCQYLSGSLNHAYDYASGEGIRTSGYPDRPFVHCSYSFVACTINIFSSSSPITTK